MTRTVFFPREARFWRYHAAAMGFIMAVTFASLLVFHQLEPLTLASTLAWALPYTAAVLLFRWLFLTRGWARQPLGRLIPIVIAYSTVAGILVVVLVLAMVLPVLGSRLASERPGILAPGFLLRNILTNGLQAHLFISAWALVFISATSAQRAHEGEQQNLRLQIHLREAQLASLAHQLNPHFLFNALNNIRFMIQEDGPRAEAILVSLSELLRHALEHGTEAKTTLERELEMLEAYVVIVRLHLEDRLDFRLSVPSHLLPCLVPPMVLQLLVENAVKHGLEPLPRGGLLQVEAREEGAQLRFTVENDQPSHRPEAAAGTPGLGLGLGNIARRLQLLYGDRAHLEVLPAPSRFRVALTLPKEVAP